MDFLVEFEPGRSRHDRFLDLEEALRMWSGGQLIWSTGMLSKKVGNYLRRRQILGDAEPVYVAG